MTATPVELVDTDIVSDAVHYDGFALAWAVRRGHLSAPTDVDGTPMWDLAQVRRELGVYRRRAARRPRWPAATGRKLNAEHAAASRRHDMLAARVVVTHVGDDLASVSDGLGRELGSVSLGDTLTHSDVWLIEPPSRAGHAETWDLPYAGTCADAIRRLATGAYGPL